MFVITADQRGSRTAPDQVPAVLERLNRHRTVRPFERTAGDEVQGLLDDPAVVVSVMVALLRAGWWVGLGVGAVSRPLPRSARAGRGAAYVAARRAVESAKSAPGGVAVAAGASATRPAGGEPPAPGGPADDADQAEAAAWLLAALLSRRTREGWEVVDLVAAGANGVEAAAKLGISPQAVSSRLRVAGWAEEQRGRALLEWLVARVDAAPGRGVPKKESPEEG